MGDNGMITNMKSPRPQKGPGTMWHHAAKT
jgi:hypothetical protein